MLIDWNGERSPLLYLKEDPFQTEIQNIVFISLESDCDTETERFIDEWYTLNDKKSFIISFLTNNENRKFFLLSGGYPTWLNIDSAGRMSYMKLKFKKSLDITRKYKIESLLKTP